MCILLYFMFQTPYYLNRLFSTNSSRRCFFISKQGKAIQNKFNQFYSWDQEIRHLGIKQSKFLILQEDHCEDWWTEPHYPVKGSSKPVWGQNPEEKTYSRGLHKLQELLKTIVVVVENTEGVHRSRTLRRAVRNIKSMKIGVDSTKKSEVQF